MRILLLLSFLCFLSSVELFAMADSESVNSLAYRSYLSGLLAERYGDSNDALEYYSKAKSLDSKSETLRLKIAVEHIKKGNNESAVEMLSELSADDNVNIDAYLLLILMHSTQGNEGRASDIYIELLERLYALDKKKLKIAESLAQYRIQQRDLEKAIDIYEEIVNFHPDYEDGIYWLGFLYEEQDRRAEAVEVWEKLLALNPNHSNGLNSLAFIYAEEDKNLIEAERMVQLALEQHPDSVAYRDTLGWVYFKQNRLAEAKAIIEEIVNNFQDPVILDHLGDIYSKQGDFKKAIQQWEKALMLVPDNNKLKQKIIKLQDGQHDK